MANMFNPRGGRGSGAKHHGVTQMKRARHARRRAKRGKKWNNEAWKRNSPATPYWVLGGNHDGSGGIKVNGPATNPGWKVTQTVKRSVC